MELQSQFTVSLRNKDNLKDALQMIADKEGFTSQVEILSHLVKSYKKPGSQAKKDNLFTAEIPERGRQIVKELQETMFDKYSFSTNGPIVLHFAKLQKAIEEGRAFIITPPKAVQKIINTQGQELVDEGDYRSLSEYITYHACRSIKKPKEEEKKSEEPKKSSFW